jgi:membrane protease YdiL (CAAX protease family)
LACGANGFAEELVMRGYLIVRLQRLFGSLTRAVILTSILFAAYHIYQGPRATVDVMLDGLIYGVAFCFLRRVWPVALAHALTNVLALGQLGV